MQVGLALARQRNQLSGVELQRDLAGFIVSCNGCVTCTVSPHNSPSVRAVGTQEKEDTAGYRLPVLLLKT